MIYIGADHRGYNLKEVLKSYFGKLGLGCEDLGAKEMIPDDDYPDYALPVAKKVAENPESDRGIVICGSGVGVDVVSNKVKEIRSALCFNIDQAKASRNDDDANILALASDFLSEDLAKEITKTWLGTPFSGEDRHKRRIEKIKQIEK